MTLTANPEYLKQRLFQRVKPLEALGLLFNIGIIALRVYSLSSGFPLPYDYDIYMEAARGNLDQGYFYPNWFLPVVELFHLLPFAVGYALFALIGLAGVFGASRIFRGPTPFVLLAFPMLYIHTYGNVAGWLVGAVALVWWAIAHKQWHLAGLGLVIACVKPQIGVPLGLALMLLADISWKQRATILIVPAVISIASLVIWPLWPLDLLERIQTSPPDTQGSITLWEWIGPLAVVVWLPPLLLPLKLEARLIGIVAATVLGQPYYQQTDIMMLFVLPIGAWFPLASNVGYLLTTVGPVIFNLYTVGTCIVYGQAMLPGVRQALGSGEQPNREASGRL